MCAAQRDHPRSGVARVPGGRSPAPGDRGSPGGRRGAPGGPRDAPGAHFLGYLITLPFGTKLFPFFFPKFGTKLLGQNSGTKSPGQIPTKNRDFGQIPALFATWANPGFRNEVLIRKIAKIAKIAKKCQNRRFVYICPSGAKIGLWGPGPAPAPRPGGPPGGAPRGGGRRGPPGRPPGRPAARRPAPPAGTPPGAPRGVPWVGRRTLPGACLYPWGRSGKRRSRRITLRQGELQSAPRRVSGANWIAAGAVRRSTAKQETVCESVPRAEATAHVTPALAEQAHADLAALATPF